MKSFCLVFLAVIQAFSVNCTIFLWSNKQFDIFPLQKFTDDDLAQVVSMMDNPKLVAYSNPNQNLPSKLKDLVHDSFSAYTTNDELLYLDTIGRF